jgi:hypothetical protein
VLRARSGRKRYNVAMSLRVLVGVLASVLLVSSAFAGCSDETEQAAVTTSGDGGGGTGGTGGAGGVGGGGGVVVNECEVLGLPERAWLDAPDDKALYATAADLIIPTLDGDYSLKDRWTGCDAILFIQDNPRQNSSYDWPQALWSRDVDDLLARAPRNTRFFFSSTAVDQGEIDAAIAGLRSEIDTALAAMSEEDRLWWTGRIHYVAGSSRGLPGWLGSAMTSPGWGFGIDRFQRVRYIGSYGDPSRFNNNAGWFAPNLSMAANEVVQYNFEAEREAVLDAQNATVVSVFPGGPTSDGAPTDVTFPDAQTMAGFDSMELDMYMGCVGDGEFGDCPAWDYMSYVYLCDDPNDPDNCTVEIGRWITTYHREGRWVHDVSGLLPLFAAGGTFRLKFQCQNPYELKFDIRLFNQGKAERPTETTYLFDSFGVPFNSTYNDGFQPMTVDIPSDATKVELATIISGHGQNSPGNCAEFCVTSHHFFVNGSENVVTLSDADSPSACMDQVDQGTIPNQYGTWWYGRSGWCPGKEVPFEVIDITSQVNIGQTNTIDYEGYMNMLPYTGSATIRMRSWVIVSK